MSAGLLGHQPFHPSVPVGHRSVRLHPYLSVPQSWWFLAGKPDAPRTPVQLEGFMSTCLSTVSDLLDFVSTVNYRRRFFRMKRKLVVREGRSTQIPERETRRRRRSIKYNPSHLLQGPECEVFLSHSYVWLRKQKGSVELEALHGTLRVPTPHTRPMLHGQTWIVPVTRPPEGVVAFMRSGPSTVFSAVAFWRLEVQRLMAAASRTMFHGRVRTKGPNSQCSQCFQTLLPGHEIAQKKWSGILRNLDANLCTLPFLRKSGKNWFTMEGGIEFSHHPQVILRITLVLWRCSLTCTDTGAIRRW